VNKPEVTLTAFMLFGCSSRSLPPPPPDASTECADCWTACGKADSYKLAVLCTQACSELCAEAR
jgi:hypothetical protein